MRKFMLFLIISIFCVVTNAHSSDEAKGDSQIVNEFADCTQIVLQKKLIYIIAQLQKKYFLERFLQNMHNLQRSLLLLL